MTQEFYLGIYLKEMKSLEKIAARLCSLQHYLQQPRQTT